jgi:NADPH:quinone reductase-like Zn-dependent oxidoreductase
MRAAIVTEYGSPITVVEVDRPSLAPDSVMIEVYASSVNPIDSLIARGVMKEQLPYQLPWVVGYDVSGVVVECGADVTDFRMADEVFGRADSFQAGTMAEFAMIKQGDLAIKPTNVSHLQAAGVPLAGLTAWQALVEHGHVQRGEKVLIHAGSGGVGSLAIQIAKHLGAVVATTTSGSNLGMVTDLGADVAIDYQTQRFDEELSDYDVVIDTLGGESLERSFATVKRGGRVVSIKGEAPKGLADERGVHFMAFYMSPSGAMLTTLAGLIESGALRPIVDSVFPLSEVQQAFDHSDAGRARGKIIIQVK